MAGRTIIVNTNVQTLFRSFIGKRQCIDVNMISDQYYFGPDDQGGRGEKEHM